MTIIGDIFIEFKDVGAKLLPWSGWNVWLQWWIHVVWVELADACYTRHSSWPSA